MIFQIFIFYSYSSPIGGPRLLLALVFQLTILACKFRRWTLPLNCAHIWRDTVAYNNILPHTYVPLE